MRSGLAAEVPLTPRPWSLQYIYLVSGECVLAPNVRNMGNEPSRTDFTTQTAELDERFLEPLGWPACGEENRSMQGTAHGQDRWTCDDGGGLADDRKS
jgi:hypothetical protein